MALTKIITPYAPFPLFSRQKTAGTKNEGLGYLWQFVVIDIFLYFFQTSKVFFFENSSIKKFIQKSRECGGP